MRRIFYKIIASLLKIYWFIFRPKTSGVKCVVEHSGKILLIRNTYGYWPWTFPGGGIKHGESLEQAAAREVLEEVGIAVNDLRRVGEFMTTAEYKRDTVTVFATNVVDDRFKIDEKEILEARWFSPDNLPPVSGYAKGIIAIWNNGK